MYTDHAWMDLVASGRLLKDRMRDDHVNQLGRFDVRRAVVLDDDGTPQFPAIPFIELKVGQAFVIVLEKEPEKIIGSGVWLCTNEPGECFTYTELTAIQFSDMDSLKRGVKILRAGPALTQNRFAGLVV